MANVNEMKEMIIITQNTISILVVRNSIIRMVEVTSINNRINLRVRRNTRSYMGHQFFFTVLLTILSHFSQ